MFIRPVRAIVVVATIVAGIWVYTFSRQNYEVYDNIITVLVYETESIDESPALTMVEEMKRLHGMDAYLFGSGEGFEGYGSKYAAVYPILKTFAPDQLIIISDGRDVLLNNPSSTDRYISSVAFEFRTAFDRLTSGEYKGAVVISAEAQCCVSALTHAEPGSYFNNDGSRKDRACSSGEEDCLWNGDDKAQPWETFMQSLSIERTNQRYDDVYLNAGLMAGTAQDLIRMIENAGIGKDEDDQAVLTDYMYHNPNAIVLDYGQTMFGNNRGGLNDMYNLDTCMFTLPDDDIYQRLIHTKTNTTPLFVHSPGGFLQCHDVLAKKLGVKATATKTRRLTEKKQIFGDKNGCNYAKICLGDKDGWLGLGKGKDRPKIVPGNNNN